MKELMFEVLSHLRPDDMEQACLVSSLWNKLCLETLKPYNQIVSHLLQRAIKKYFSSSVKQQKTTADYLGR